MVGFVFEETYKSSRPTKGSRGILVPPEVLDADYHTIVPVSLVSIDA